MSEVYRNVQCRQYRVNMLSNVIVKPREVRGETINNVSPESCYLNSKTISWGYLQMLSK